jgi:hypothetical protein
MANAYVTLWTVERCKWLQRVRDEGPLEVVFGGPHTSQPSIAAVRPGDIIYPVAVLDGALRLIASLAVDRLCAPDDFVRERLGIELGAKEMWDTLFHDLKKTRPEVGHRLPITCADHAAIGKGSTFRFDRVFPPNELELLRLGSKAGSEQPLTGVVEGRLKNNFSLQGHVRRLSADSAERFAQQFDTE